MKLTLTTTWNPRGELPRLKQYAPLFREAYQQIVVVLPPSVEKSLVDAVIPLGMISVISQDWSWGRYLALQKALDTDPDFIHYADLDRLLRWVETREDEWRHSVSILSDVDCICFGRSPAAYASHPRAMIETEAISNQAVSHLLGRKVDISAGSKSFSYQAARFLVAHTQPGTSMGMDAAWLVLLNRAGFQMKYVEVDGLDWESADQYRLSAADTETQSRTAAEYDRDPKHWAWRVQVAEEVVKMGFWAARQPINNDWLNPNAHFEADDYLYFYRPHLSDERTILEVNAIINLLDLRSPLDILDLACGFGRHANLLAKQGHRMTGVDIEKRFLELAKTQADEMGLAVDYHAEDMRELWFEQAFDLVLLLFTAFGYFDDAENLAVLRGVHRALRPGGRFIMDVPNRDNFIKHLVPAHVDELGLDLMINRGSYDSETRRWYNRRVVIRNGVRKDKPFFVRLYNEAEIREILKQVGLEAVQIYSGWKQEPLTDESIRMVIIARRS